jgi:lysophospholipase L1-like esterase
MKKVRLFISCMLVAGAPFACNVDNEVYMNKDKAVRYIALGDSYTICEGAQINQSWPRLLEGHLKEKGMNVELVANPSVTGYTTQNLIERELPVFEKSDADFVTLLIGVNDWVHGVDTEMFTQNLRYIIDQVQGKIKDKKKIILITIPDFGVTPTGAMYSGGRDISAGIAEFNAIILKEAQKRGLPSVDIFQLSKGMKNDPGLIARDGLHPSAREYALWEELILPVAVDLLKK